MDSEHEAALLTELFPGIPNDVAVAEIATKLPWRDADALSSVSPSWRQAIEARVVYDARVLAHSTETLVVLRIFDDNEKFTGLSLYSVRERTLSRLPPLPVLVSSVYQFVTVDGGLYVLGGTGGAARSQNVYMLDLAGQKDWRQRQWKRCANMLHRRICFGCGALNGKIYVFGSIFAGTLKKCGFYRGEMYDPKVDAWFAIPPSPRWSGICGTPRVIPVGEELIVLDWFGYEKTSWQVYHPLRDEWRLESHQYRSTDYFLPRNIRGMIDIPFYAEGEGYFRVYNAATYSWIPRCSKFFDGDGLINAKRVEMHYILPVADELLALGKVTFTSESGFEFYQYSLFQSNGFGSQEKDTLIVWERLPYVFTKENYRFGAMCTIEL